MTGNDDVRLAAEPANVDLATVGAAHPPIQPAVEAARKVAGRMAKANLGLDVDLSTIDVTTFGGVQALLASVIRASAEHRVTSGQCRAISTALQIATKILEIELAAAERQAEREARNALPARRV